MGFRWRSSKPTDTGYTVLGTPYVQNLPAGGGTRRLPGTNCSSRYSAACCRKVFVQDKAPAARLTYLQHNQGKMQSNDSLPLYHQRMVVMLDYDMSLGGGGGRHNALPSSQKIPVVADAT